MRPKQSSLPGESTPTSTTEGSDSCTVESGTPLQNFAMLVAYDGAPFQGWQIQPHGLTVQSRLEEVLGVICRQRVKVYGSGRTDTGVNAVGQVAHFRASGQYDLRKMQYSLNALGAPSISVKCLVPVADSFHARHSAIGKRYRYHIFNRPYPPVFGRERCWWIRTPLDVPAMAEAARALVGTHDFSAFRASDCAAKSPIREIRSLRVREEEHNDSSIRIEIEASGFLQHMARIIAGTLTAVGQGRIPPEKVGQILAGRQRESAEITAPGKGLYLVRVIYDLGAYPELRAFEEIGEG